MVDPGFTKFMYAAVLKVVNGTVPSIVNNQSIMNDD